MKRFFESFVIIICIAFVLTGCGKNEEVTIENKLNSEMRYIEDLIFKLANKDAKGEFLENDIFNWQYVKDDVNAINDSWSNLVLDLTEINVKNEEIVEFGNILSNLLISISNEDHGVFTEKLAQMYEKIVKFEQSYSQNQNSIKKKQIKSQILKVYSIADKQDWPNAKTQIDSTLANYKNLMNDLEYAKENTYNLNKIYVLLEEYRNSIYLENYDLERMKYVGVIEEL